MRPFAISALCLLTLLAPAPGADEAIFEPGARLKVEAGDGAGGEGPAWHPKLGVLSSGNNHIYQFDRDGQSRVWPTALVAEHSETTRNSHTALSLIGRLLYSTARASARAGSQA